MQFRNIFLGIGSIAVVLLLFITDPDTGFLFSIPIGASTITVLLVLASSILYVGLLHLARKGLIDYVDLKVLFTNAVRTPEGSGLAIIGVGLIMISIAIVILAATT